MPFGNRALRFHLFCNRFSHFPVRFGFDPQRSQRLGQGLRLQHHAFPAAKRPVVHGPMAVVGERPEIVDTHLDQPLGQRPAQDSILEDARKEARKDGDDLKFHTTS